MAAPGAADLGALRAEKLKVVRRAHPEAGSVLVDEAESPLAWLARRKGRDGRPLIEPAQFLAGERLRADFTFAQMTPRLSLDWTGVPSAGGGGAGGPASMTDRVVAARQRFSAALDAVGAEFSGLLVDVCCFLARLEEIERQRGWPPRSAKIVLQLGLDRLPPPYRPANA
ncbi:DUF6456 domain-containing protein, partial [Rhodovulum sp. PH10]|uniref:DUF6456 domain-containing protein n=1 Tax=Rhodovulum sp. PH10 TaxID=1187851 RepID=UPI00068F9C39